METEVWMEEAACIEYEDNDDSIQHPTLDCLTSPGGCCVFTPSSFLALLWLEAYTDECTALYRLLCHSKDNEKYTVEAVRPAGMAHAGYRAGHDRANKCPEAARANLWRRHTSILNLNG